MPPFSLLSPRRTDRPFYERDVTKANTTGQQQIAAKWHSSASYRGRIGVMREYAEKVNKKGPHPRARPVQQGGLPAPRGHESAKQSLYGANALK